MNKRDLFIILICVCLVGVSSYSLNELISSSRSHNNQKSDLTLSTPGYSLGLHSLTMEMADLGLSTAESGVSFLVEEAGICAYGNVGQEINLTEAKKPFRGLEYECEDYIVGSLPVPGYSESEDVHVYVHRAGWIVSYYSKTELVAKIIKDFMTPEDNKIEDGIAVVCSALLIAKPEINYYDFRYPNANTILVVGDNASIQGTGSNNNTFRIFIPSEIANNISRFEWYYASNYEHNKFGVHGQVISSGVHTGTYGTITLVPSSYPDEILQATDLKLDTQTTAWVYALGGTTYPSPRWADGGFIILLHYD